MRRNRLDVRQGGHAPLVILAGLPHPICAAVARAIEAGCSPRPRVVYGPSGNDGCRLYKETTVSMLMNAVSGYAVRCLKAHVAPPPPKHIILAYVPAEDEERLLAEFDFFVFPVRLSRLADYDRHGRQCRHDRDLAEEYVVSSLETDLREFMEIKRRLSSACDREPLFLPPQNFKISESERMAEVFRGMVRQTASWADPFTRVRRVRVTSEDLPKFVRPGAQKAVLADVRGLLFPSDPSQHGLARELPKDSSPQDKKHLMRSLFRFGVRLNDGYHHDVQYAGRSLKGETFDCSRQGSVVLRCSYANVYPNDYVRPSKT
jgi:hypothetical protein